MIVIYILVVLILLITISILVENPNREKHIYVPTYYQENSSSFIHHKFSTLKNILTKNPEFVTFDQDTNVLAVKGFISPDIPEIETLQIDNQVVTLRRSKWVIRSNLHKISELFTCSKDPIFKYISEKYKIKITAPANGFCQNDIWLRDEFQVGYMDKYTYILNGPRNRKLDKWIHEYASQENHINHFHLENLCDDGTFNYFGNLICLTDHQILYGVDEYGYGTCDRILDFIQNQKQQQLISIETGWLSVGHVDEIVCVMPDGRIAMASPKLAVQHLLALPDNALVQLADKTMKAKDILDTYANYNLMIEDKKLSTAKKKLNPSIELPVLFYPDQDGRALALSYNVINVVVDPRFIIVPTDNGPIINGIPKWGMPMWKHYFPNIEIIQMNSVEYHNLHGGIHCATNEIRMKI